MTLNLVIKYDTHNYDNYENQFQVWYDILKHKKYISNSTVVFYCYNTNMKYIGRP